MDVYCASFVLLCLLTHTFAAIPLENEPDDTCLLDVEKVRRLVNSKSSGASSCGCEEWSLNLKKALEELSKDKCNTSDKPTALLTELKSVLQQEIESAKSSLASTQNQRLEEFKEELKSELNSACASYSKEVNTLISDMRWLTSEHSKFSSEMKEKSDSNSKEVQGLIGLVKNVNAEIQSMKWPVEDGPGDLTGEVQRLGTLLTEAIAEQNKFAREVNAKFMDVIRILEAQSKDIKELKADSDRQRPECPTNSTSLTTLPNGKKYFFSNATLLNWKAAKAFCEMEKMHLASPKTQQELTFLHQKAKEIDSGKSHWWLVSASDVGREPGAFEWHDGTSLSKNSHMWSKGEPDQFSAGKEDCVYFNTGKSDKLWDYMCSFTDSFICELPATCW